MPAKAAIKAQMNREKVILPDFLVADLYKDSLVELSIFSMQHNDSKPKDLEVKTASRTEEAGAGEMNIEYLGNNAKKVVVIVDQEDCAYLPDDDFKFLTNILKACQLTLEDIAIINLSRQKATYPQIRKQLNGLYFILFNVEPAIIKIPFKIPSFQLQKYDGCAIIHAPALSTINRSTQEGRLLKTKLWVSLKQVFEIEA